jgi:hypothetical protein
MWMVSRSDVHVDERPKDKVNDGVNYLQLEACKDALVPPYF